MATEINIYYQNNLIAKVDENQRVVLDLEGMTTNSAIIIEHKILSTKIDVTGSGDATYCYIQINGTKVTATGTYTVVPGDIITFGVYGYSSTYYGEVTVDGTQVLKVTDKTTHTYEYTIPQKENISISMTYTSTSTRRNGRINITT